MNCRVSEVDERAPVEPVLVDLCTQGVVPLVEANVAVEPGPLVRAVRASAYEAVASHFRAGDLGAELLALGLADLVHRLD